MSRAVKSRLRKLERAQKGGVVVKVWNGTGPKPQLEPGDPRTLILVNTGVPRSKAFRARHSGAPE